MRRDLFSRRWIYSATCQTESCNDMTATPRRIPPGSPRTSHSASEPEEPFYYTLWISLRTDSRLRDSVRLRAWKANRQLS